MSRLVVNPDTPEAWPIELEPGSISLGRGEENEQRIDHPSVSTTHGRVSVTDAGTWIEDLGSTGGTFVNDELVEKVRLLAGQLVRLGEVNLRFESEAPEDQKPSMATPPLPPRITPLPFASENPFCKFHPEAHGRFSCSKCRRLLCDLCVVRRNNRTYCRRCGTECQPVQIQAPRADPETEAGFLAALPRALTYPFQGSGVMVLVAGTAFFYILGWMPLLGLIVTGYLFNYAKSIITATADGKKELPDWPDFGDWKDDILMPYLQMIVLALLFFGPAFIIAILRPGNGTEARIAFFAALGFGALLAPMAMLAVAMFDSFAAFNPIALTYSILRVPFHYLIAAVAFELAIGLHWFTEGTLRTLLPVPFLPGLISSFAYLYLMAVGMRILGLLYRNHKAELGWFGRTGTG
jgi:pSer/pThr/pTyr-binding forkhead associated (FHA) protein